MSSNSRRRSSQHHKRISLLPNEIEDEHPKPRTLQISRSEQQRAAICIKSTILAINSEFSKADSIIPFSEDASSLTHQILQNLGCSNGLETNNDISLGDDNSDSSLIPSKSTSQSNILPLETMQCRAKRIKDLREEKSKWEKLLQKFEEQARCPGLDQQPNKVIECKNVPECVKNRAVKCQYLTGHFPYDDITTKCQQLFDKTTLEMEKCISKTNQLRKVQDRMNKLVEEQFENFMSNMQDTSILSTSDNDIRQIIEKRIALVSPSNNN